MGEIEFIDGTKEKGEWKDGFKQGVFECFDVNGAKTGEKFYDDYEENERAKMEYFMNRND